VLLVATLQEAGYSADWQRVDTEPDFRAALATDPDVILADYQLPDYDALSAIRLVNSLGLDTPIIVVTGALGDEAAAECIKLGATDYILKDRLARLGLAVANALEQKRLRTERKRAADALSASEQRFRAVFRDSPIGLAVLDAGGSILEANPALCAMLAMDERETRGRACTELLAPTDRQPRNRLRDMLASRCKLRATIRANIVGGSGQTVPVSLTVAPLNAEETAEGSALLIAEDLSNKVAADRAGRQRDAILHATGQAAEAFLSAGEWDASLSTFLGLIGAAASASAASIVRLDLQGRATTVRCWPVDQGRPRSAIVEALQGAVASHAGQLSGAGAQRVVVAEPPQVLAQSHPAVVLAPITVRRMCWGCLAVASDPPDRAWHEQELSAFQYAAELLGDAIQDREASLQLQASEERARLLVDTSLDAVISAGQDGFITGWNPQAELMFGYAADEVLDTPVLSVVAPADRHAEWRASGVRPLDDTGEPLAPRRFEAVAVRRNGERFPVEVAVSSANLNGSAMLSLFVRDLTAAKEAELALLGAQRRDEEIAAKIQEALLVGDPTVATGWLQMAVDAQPGRLISGDFVLSLHHTDTVVDVVIGDVMGKGLTAALLGAITKNYLYEATRQLVRHLGPFGRLPEPHEIVAAVHQHMSKDLQDMDSFVTLCYARFDKAQARCTIVDCGHTRTVHYISATGECELLKGDNLPLGVAEREFFAPIHTGFSPGDSFLLYSDGVLETENDRLEQFGEERVVQAVRRLAGAPPSSVVDAIRAAVSEFAGPTEPTDDLTCVAIQLLAEATGMPATVRTLEVPGDLGELPRVREFVAGLAEDALGPALPSDEVDRFVLAAHEAVCNVVEHAHGQRPEFRVQLIAEAYPDRFELRIYDSGTGFNLRGVPEPELGTARPQALGVYFINQGADRCEYERDDLGRNFLRLVKRR